MESELKKVNFLIAFGVFLALCVVSVFVPTKSHAVAPVKHEVPLLLSPSTNVPKERKVPHMAILLGSKRPIIVPTVCIKEKGQKVCKLKR